MSKKKKKMSAYKKSLLIFALILLILGEGVLFYVNNTLKAYELGDVTNYMDNLVKDITSAAKSGNINKYFTLKDVKGNSNYEKNSSLKEGYKALFSNNEITYKKTSEDNYELYAGDRLIAKIELDGSDLVTKLGIFTYCNYKIKNIETYDENGLFTLDIYTSSDVKLYINDIEVKDDDLESQTKIEELVDAYDYIDLPKLNHYVIDNLMNEPKLSAKDESGNDITVTQEDGKYYAESFYKTDDENDAMSHLNNTFDSLAFAENWALFLSNDLSGSAHGLYTLTPNMIKGTTPYQMAYAWGTGVDVTFTSKHTLNNPIFENEKVSNFTIYSKDAYSVEVYLEEPINIANGQKNTRVLHDIFYWIYYDGAYRLINTKSVGDN